MAESRVIRKGFVDSGRVNALGWFAECFYHRLLLMADDYGLYDARPAYLRAQLFGMKLEAVGVDDIKEALDECAAAGLVQLYTVGGKPYLKIDGYGQRTRTKQRYPEPPAATCGNPPQSAATCGNPPQSAATCGGKTDGILKNDGLSMLSENPPQPAAICRNLPQSAASRDAGLRAGAESESESESETYTHIESVNDNTTATSARKPPQETPAKDAVMAEMGRLMLANLNLTECAERFLDDMEACGWLDRRGVPIRRWQAAARNYARRYAENEAKRTMRGTGNTNNERKDCNDPADYA